MPSYPNLISVISRNHVHMKMEYCLPCCLLIILYDIVTITFQHILQLYSHFLSQQQCFRRKFIVQIIQIAVMLLRNNQRMSFRCRTHIQDYPKVVILMQSR